MPATSKTARPVDPTSPMECPWSDLQPHGEGLSVHNFLTTRLSAVSNGLRRNITLPYASDAGLNVSEWRLLSLIGHAGELPFGQLVQESTSDKALVSRALRALEARGLVSVEPDAGGNKKKLVCRITPEGQALHAQVIPVARERQATAICELTPAERRVFFRALTKLAAYCQALETKTPPRSGGGVDE